MTRKNPDFYFLLPYEVEGFRKLIFSAKASREKVYNMRVQRTLVQNIIRPHSSNTIHKIYSSSIKKRLQENRKKYEVDFMTFEEKSF